jgi:tRNA pseudouridine38-40 synthase
VVTVPVSHVPDDLERVARSLNALTPDDVAVREVSVVDDAFDPRRHARSRLYEYRVLTARTPSAFCGADADPVLSTVRRVLVSEVCRDGELLVYRIEATAFLKHMVRNIVGVLLEAGKGNLTRADIEKRLARGCAIPAGPSAPARGLFLVGVEY